MPNAPKARVYRFKVERVYKGLDPKVTEVVVNPDNLTSCQEEYRTRVRYIIFGGQTPTTSMIAAGGCSGSRIAETHQDDVRFLNQFADGKSQTSISGRVVQWLTNSGWPNPNEDAPVPGVTVTLDDGSSKLSRQANVDGEFRFDLLRAGRYTLSAQADEFGGLRVPYQLEVAPGGCVETFPLLPPLTTLSGTLALADGAPAKKTRVEVLRKNNAGKWYSTYQFWTTTDEQGRFQFKDLPSGNYLVGYEIWTDRPSQYSGYPTRYFPGVAHREQGTVIHLSPRQSIEGLSFRLSEPHKPRSIRVEVVWPDGTAPTEHLLQLFDDDRLITNLGWSIPGKPPAIHQGVFEFSGYEERAYTVHARYWIDDLGGAAPSEQQRIAKTDALEIKPGKGSISVRLVLTKNLLSSQER